MRPNNEMINILFYNDVKGKSTKDVYAPSYLADYVPIYLVKKVDIGEQQLIAKVQQLSSQGIRTKQIMMETNLPKEKVAEYLQRPVYNVTNPDSYEVAFAPITNRYTLSELEGLGYNYDDLEPELQQYFADIKITLEKQTDGLYMANQNTYGAKTM